MLEVERLQNVFEVVIRQISNFKSIFSFISVENMSNIIFLFYLKASKEDKGLPPHTHHPFRTLDLYIQRPNESKGYPDDNWAACPGRSNISHQDEKRNK